MKRRLFIRPGAIGDFVLSLPTIEYLKSGSGYLEVWSALQNVPLALRAADHAAAISSTGLDLLGLPGVPAPDGVVRALRSYDEIVSCYGTGRPEFRASVSAVGLPFRFLAALPPKEGGVHAADFFLAQAGGQGPAMPKLKCGGAAHGCVAIHPFSGGRAKNWPLQRFRELASHLAGGGCDVAWCAGPEESLAAGPPAVHQGGIPGPLSGVVRITDLYELACWLSGARLYVGNDSGITHLAAAAGASVVALFGPTDPAVWAPRGAEVRIVAGNPIEEISVERVMEACRELL